jgi:hypothetical protein
VLRNSTSAIPRAVESKVWAQNVLLMPSFVQNATKDVLFVLFIRLSVQSNQHIIC